MSGGSFDYLCSKENLGQLTESEDQLKSMADWLREHGYIRAAGATAEIMVILSLAQEDIGLRLRDRGLAEVWRAVEYFVSCDTGLTSLEAALQKYEEANQ